MRSHEWATIPAGCLQEWLAGGVQARKGAGVRHRESEPDAGVGPAVVKAMAVVGIDIASVSRLSANCRRSGLVLSDTDSRELAWMDWSCERRVRISSAVRAGGCTGLRLRV